MLIPWISFRSLCYCISEPSLAIRNTDCFPMIPLGWVSPWPDWRESLLLFLGSTFSWTLLWTVIRGRSHGRDLHGRLITTSPTLSLESLGTCLSHFPEWMWPPAGTPGLSQNRQATTSLESPHASNCRHARTKRLMGMCRFALLSGAIHHKGDALEENSTCLPPSRVFAFSERIKFNTGGHERHKTTTYHFLWALN